jgi:hypothetical protein
MTLPFLPSSNWSQMESQKKHRRELTAKQRALVRALAKTKHLGKAAIEAGYSPKNATQSAAQALASIRKTAPGLLAKHGLDDDSLIEKHLIPLLQAQETKYFAYTRQGKRLLLERNVAAHSIRANALDMAFKIRGLYVREQENKGPEFSVVAMRTGDDGTCTWRCAGNGTLPRWPWPEGSECGCTGCGGRAGNIQTGSNSVRTRDSSVSEMACSRTPSH